MAATKKAAKSAPAAAGWRVGKRTGFFKVTVAIELAQFQAVKAEADGRALDRGAGRSDVSEVVREALAAWMARKR